MEALANASAKIDEDLEGRRARTRHEREESLLTMEAELRNSLENRWRETLAQIKADGMRRVAEEEESGRLQCAELAQSISSQLHETYSDKLRDLDMERQKRQKRSKVLMVEIESLSKAAQEAEAELSARRSSLEDRRARTNEQNKNQAEQYHQLQEQLNGIWESKQVPLSERVEFLMKADQASTYSKEALILYEQQIIELERASPILALIKKREELGVRMEILRGYCRNPDLGIRDGSAALLQRVGFTLPTPMPIHEAELMALPETMQNARRDKIRREAACHKLLQQWALCQQELMIVTNELQSMLDQYAQSSVDGHRFSQDGKGGSPYTIPLLSQDITSEPLDLSKFSSMQIVAMEQKLRRY